MIFPGFPGVLLFFQVFQVKWEPWTYEPKIKVLICNCLECADVVCYDTRVEKDL